MGRLSGPELTVGVTGYQSGDRIVTLAPGANGRVVTSECGTVLAVDPGHGDMVATMDDGRLQRFAGEDLDAAHLAHAYAVTVHRSQGATVGRAHVLEDGGGRELAYVKMSRAKEHTTVYAVADDLPQAVEDLGRSWSASRRIGWVIDRSVASTNSPAVEAAKTADHTVAANLRHARLVAEREALAAVIPPDSGWEYHRIARDVQRLNMRLAALDKGDGWGELRGTPVGEAAVAWKQAVGEQRGCLARAQHAGVREGHQLRKQAARAGERVEPLRQAFEALAGPERARIRTELPGAEKRLAELERQYYGHMHFQNIHPEARRRLDRLDREIAGAAWEMDLEREGIDGIAPRRPEPLQPPRALEREVPRLERGIELERGFGLEL